MSKIDPNYWYNLARIATLFGGLLTFVGGIGLWQFGKIIAIDTNKEIQENKRIAAEANAEVEKAKLDVENAKIESAMANKMAALANSEAEKAKLKVSEITLDIAKANAEAEKAKLERDKIKDRLNYINAISFYIELSIPIETNTGQAPKNTITPVNGNEKIILFVASKKGQPIEFTLSSWNSKYDKAHRIIGLNFNQPLAPSKIYGKPIKEFSNLTSLHVWTKEFLNKNVKEYNRSAKIDFKITVFANGKEVVTYTSSESKIGDFYEKSLEANLAPAFMRVPNVILGEEIEL